MTIGSAAMETVKNCLELLANKEKDRAMQDLKDAEAAADAANQVLDAAHQNVKAARKGGQTDSARKLYNIAIQNDDIATQNLPVAKKTRRLLFKM